MLYVHWRELFFFKDLSVDAWLFARMLTLCNLSWQGNSQNQKPHNLGICPLAHIQNSWSLEASLETVTGSGNSCPGWWSSCWIQHLDAHDHAHLMKKHKNGNLPLTLRLKTWSIQLAWGLTSCHANSFQLEFPLAPWGSAKQENSAKHWCWHCTRSESETWGPRLIWFTPTQRTQPQAVGTEPEHDGGIASFNLLIWIQLQQRSKVIQFMPYLYWSYIIVAFAVKSHLNLLIPYI